MKPARNMKELRLKFEGVARWHAFCHRQELIATAASRDDKASFWAGKAVVAFAESVLLSYDMVHLNARKEAEEELKADQSRDGRGTG